MAPQIMARALELRGDYTAAVGVWKQIGSADVLLRVAEAATEAGQLDAALDALYAAWELDPTGRSTGGLAKFLWEEQDDLAAAEAVMRKSIAAYPRFQYYDEWLYLLADILEAQAKWSEAAGVYQQVIAENSDDWQAHIKLGWMVYQRGDGPEAALAEFRQAIDLVPDRGYGYLAIGRLHAREGQYAEADDWFRMALERDTTYLWDDIRTESTRATDELSAAYESAWTHYLIGNTRQAVRDIESPLKLAPDNPYVLRLAGRIYERAGETEKAIAAYQRALAVNPADQTALQALQRLTGD